MHLEPKLQRVLVDQMDPLNLSEENVERFVLTWG